MNSKLETRGSTHVCIIKPNSQPTITKAPSSQGSSNGYWTAKDAQLVILL